jgi:leucyl aminopeptidase
MLTIDWTTNEPEVTAGQLLAVPIQSEDAAESVEARFSPEIGQAVENAKFEGKTGQSYRFTRDADGHFQQVLLLGVGEALDNARTLRVLAHDTTREAVSLGVQHVVLDLRGVADDLADIPHASVGDRISQGLELGTYAFERFLSEDKRTPVRVREVTVIGRSRAPADGVARGQTVASVIARARDLTNGPAELVTPSHLAEVAKEIVDSHVDADASMTVLEEDECRARGMGCYLGVAQGSDSPPKFIHMHYRPKGECRGRVCLVGKGVTFDSGGYSLKPTEAMTDMKMDMAGAAVVIAAFDGVVRLELPWELHVIVPATENMVSGRAYRLGDILTASNGKTVEINNTDAEGRLTLADGLVYAAKLEPDFMIDFATLTGACMVALGPRIGGVMTDDEPLAQQWLAAAEAAGEEMWRLPLADHLRDQMKSKIADMKNTGERWGGALTAGLFLSDFIEGRRWMHVDIAGPAMASKAHGVTNEGGTGFGVATIVALLSGEGDLET